jgi:anti-sigma B factor antagonist
MTTTIGSLPNPTAPRTGTRCPASPCRSTPAAAPAPALATAAAPAPATEPAALTVSVTRGPSGATLLHLDGELEATTAPLLDCLVTDALQHQGGDVSLDLADVVFCDVKGLDCLLAVRRRVHARGRHLDVTGATALLRHLLDLTGGGDVLAPAA